jgi:hypothetical protein
VPDLDIDAHAADAHSAGFGLIAEHSYDVSHDGDATDAHFHCHNCCAHAPMMSVSFSQQPAVIKAQIVTSTVLVQLASAPVSTHFRPPRI